MFTASRPAYAYVEVAILEAVQESTYTQEDVLESLRTRAGEMGCDGLILLGSADTVTGSVGTLPGSNVVSGSVNTLHGLRATCIVRASSGGGPAAQKEPAGSLEIVVSTSATVRTAPSEAAPEVARLPPGARLAAADPPRDEWRRVRLQDGRYGFVRDLYIKIRPAAPSPPPASPVVIDPPAAPAAAACDPPCSPGYACQAAVCVALCNPRCAADEVCGGDRICRKR
jgi:hypothetical protein